VTVHSGERHAARFEPPNRFFRAMKHSLQAAAAAAVLALVPFAAPLGAAAQAGPPPGPPAGQGPAPSYATRSGDQQIAGTIVGFDGKYGVKLRDRRGYLDNVVMHQGTVINPTGLPLQNGMRVTIFGYNAGSAFAANEIDAQVPPVVVVPRPAIGLGVGFGWGWRRWR
jgi:hypothetical protein